VAASSSTAKGQGFTVRGIRFRSPDDARASARRLREEAEEHAGDLRRRGQDAEAERVVDQANEQADAYDLAAAEHETKRSRVAHREPAKRGGGQATRRPAPRLPAGGGIGHRGGGGLFGGAGAAAGRRATAAATGTAGDVLEELVLATIVVAFLTVFLSSSRGVSTFGWLTTGAARLLELVIGPSDPLKGLASSSSTSDLTGPSGSAASPAAERRLAKSTGDTAKRRKASPVVVTAGGPSRRGGH